MMIVYGRSSNRSPLRGFTLLEVMIAVAILAISLVTLLSANIRAVTLSSESHQLTAATLLAREEMERLSLNTLPTAGTSPLQQRPDYPQFRLRTTVTPTPFEGVFEVGVAVYDRGIEARDIQEGRDVMTLVAYLKQ